MRISELLTDPFSAVVDHSSMELKVGFSALIHSILIKCEYKWNESYNRHQIFFFNSRRYVHSHITARE